MPRTGFCRSLLSRLESFLDGSDRYYTQMRGYGYRIGTLPTLNPEPMALVVIDAECVSNVGRYPQILTFLFQIWGLNPVEVLSGANWGRWR